MLLLLSHSKDKYRKDAMRHTSELPRAEQKFQRIRKNNFRSYAGKFCRRAGLRGACKIIHSLNG
jgi:hypothetical protein